MNYEPRPIDTAGVRVSPNVLSVSELLARNAHEVWARQRLSDGWTYGPRRDDANKKHPCLVAYDQLPESERVYDRNAALETIKVILALGYRIEKGRQPQGRGGSRRGRARRGHP